MVEYVASGRIDFDDQGAFNGNNDVMGIVTYGVGLLDVCDCCRLDAGSLYYSGTGREVRVGYTLSGGQVMNWSSWSEFFNMGGYAFYVWGSLGVVLACLVGEIVELQWRFKKLHETKT